MREFIFYSSKARTSGNIKDLKKAGRLDIVCHVIIHSFFLSHKIRNVILHLCFDGPPDPPKHLELHGSEKMREFLSKKDISGLISRMLYKYKKGKKVEVFPRCFIEKKSFEDVILNLSDKKIYVLDISGKNIRSTELKENSVFVLGDDEGLKKKKKFLKKIKAEKISLGKEMYFSSQAVVILNNELDLRGL